jgi:uncharacterized RDD family membrane protein YckC
MSDLEINPYATPRSEVMSGEEFPGYAGFWKRFFAFVIDWLLLAGVFFLIDLLTGGLLFEPVEEEPWSIISRMLGIAIPWGYYALLESSEHQGTLGKLALHIKVTNMEGERVSFLRASARHFAKILSSMLLLLGYLMIPFTSKKQGLHDLIASCVVVNRS